MYKIIGGDRKEYGPVSLEDLLRWIREGRLNGQTLALPEGGTEWKPLSALPEFAEVLQEQASRPPPPPGPVVPADLQAWKAHLLSMPLQVRIGRCLSLSGKLLTGNLGLLFGACAVAWFVAVIFERVPFIGGILYMAIHGVLYGGLYLIFLRRIRGEAASIGDVFAGFSGPFTQLLLAGLLTSVLSTIGFCCVLPGIYLMVAWVFSLPLVADRKLEFWSAMEVSRQVVTRVFFEVFGLMLLAFLPTILVLLFINVKTSLLVFSAMQDVFRAGAPDLSRLLNSVTHVATMPLSLWFLTKVVLLLNLPFALGALMYAYEDLFGSRAAPTP
jgi:hypothetical protein